MGAHRRTSILLALALALAAAPAAAAPAAAPASGPPRTRPFFGTALRTIDLNTDTGQGTSTGSGWATHLGNYTFQGTFTSFSTSGDEYTGTIQGTFTTRRGAELFETTTITGTFVNNGTSLTVTPGPSTYAITGGTRRFRGASGSFETVGPSSSTVVAYIHGNLDLQTANFFAGTIRF